MGSSVLVKHKVSLIAQFRYPSRRINSAWRFLDRRSLVSYSRIARDKKLIYPQITQITPIKKARR